MAQNVGTAEGRITIDTSGFDSAMQRVTAALTGLSTNIASAGQSVQQFQQSLNNTGAGQAEQQLSAFGRALETVRSGLATFNDATNSTRDRLKGLADAAGTVGQGMTDKLTKPLFEVGKACVDLAAEFQAQMDKVGAIAGATGEELQQLSNYAQEMGAKTKFSSEQCGEAMEYMAMAGWSVDEVMGGLPGVLNLAAVGDLELARASDIVTDALTAFGEQADQAGRLANIMAATITSANTDVDKLGETFKYVAPIAGAAGYSMEDTAVMIGLMGDSAIKSSQAGTTLRAVINRLATGGGECGDAMDALGLSVTHQDGTMMSLMDTILMLRRALSGLSQEEQISYSKMIAGMTASSGFISLMQASDENLRKLTASVQSANYVNEENRESVETMGLAMASVMTQWQYAEEDLNGLDIELRGVNGEFGNLIEFSELLHGQWGNLTAEQQKYFAEILSDEAHLEEFNRIMGLSSEEFDKLKESMLGASGMADLLASQMMDNLKGKLALLQSATENAAIAFGTLMLPIIEKLVEALSKFVVWVNNLDEGQKKLIVTIAGVVAAIGPLLLVFSKTLSFGIDLYDNIGRLGSTFAQLGKAVTNIPGPITAVNTALGKIFPTSVTGTSGIKSLASAFTGLSLPIKAVIAVLALLAAAYATNFGNIRGVTKQFFEDHKEAFSEIGNLAKNLLGIIVSLGSGFARVIGGIIDVVRQWAKDNPEALQAISSAFETLWNVVSAVLGLILDAVGAVAKAINAVFDLFKGKESEAEASGKGIGEAFVGGLTEGADKASENAEKISDRIGETWDAAKDKAGEAGEKAGSWFSEQAESGILSKAPGISNAVTSAFGKSQESAKKAGIELADALGDGVNIGLVTAADHITAATSDEFARAFQQAGVSVSIEGKNMMDRATGEIVATWNAKIGAWEATDAGRIALALDNQVPLIAGSIDDIAAAIGAGSAKLTVEGNKLIETTTGEMIATWNAEMNRWEVTAPERIISGILKAEIDAKSAADKMGQSVANGFINQWTILGDLLSGDPTLTNALLAQSQTAAVAAAEAGGVAGLAMYDSWIAQIEDMSFKTEAQFKTFFSSLGIQLKTDGKNLMDATTGEIIATWNAGIQKFELTEAGKLALAVKAQEQPMKKSAKEILEAAGLSMNSTWDQVVKVFGEEKAVQIARALEAQTPNITNAGQQNIQGYQTGATGVWNGSTVPWLNTLGPVIQSALEKANGPANTAGSSTMQSYWDGLKTKANQILSWAGQVASQIANKLASSLVGVRVPTGGGYALERERGIFAPLINSIESSVFALDNGVARARESLATTYAGTAAIFASTSNTKLPDGAAGTVFEKLVKYIVDLLELIEEKIKEFKEKSEKQQKEYLMDYVEPVKLLFDMLAEVYEKGFDKLEKIMEKGWSFDKAVNLEGTAGNVELSFKSIMSRMNSTFESMNKLLEGTLGTLDKTWDKGLDDHLVKPLQKCMDNVNKYWTEGLGRLEQNTNNALESIQKTTGLNFKRIEDISKIYGTGVSSMWGDVSVTLGKILDKESMHDVEFSIQNLRMQISTLAGAIHDSTTEGTYFNTSMTAMYAKTEYISKSMEKVLEIFEPFGKTWKEIGDGAQAMKDGIHNLYNELWNLELLLPEIFYAFNTFEEHGDISQDSVKELNAVFKRQFAKIKDSVDEIVEVFGKREKEMGEAGTNFVQAFGKGATDEWKKFADAVTSTGVKENNKMGWFTYLLKRIQSWYMKIKGAGKEFMQNFLDGMINVWYDIEQWVNRKLNWMGNRFDTMKGMLREMRDILDDALDLSSRAMEVPQPSFPTPSSPFNGSHKNGLPYVPYDGYIAELHAGERVLTKKEAQNYRNEESRNGGDTFIFNSPKAIDAREAARLLKRTKRDILGGFS